MILIHFSVRSRQTELIQYRFPVLVGPSSNICTRMRPDTCNKLPRSQAVAVFYFENHSVLNVRLITGSLLSSTGKTTFSPTLLSSCAFIPAAKLSGNSAHGFKIQARNTDLYDCRLARERSISVRFCLRKRTLVGAISKYSSPAITSRPRSIVSS